MTQQERIFITLSPTRLFFRCALPSMVSMAVTSLYTVVDGIFVGRYVGADALAAVDVPAIEPMPGGNVEYTYVETYYLRTFDASGAEGEKIDLSAMFAEENEYFYVSNFTVDGDGNIYMMVNGAIMVIGADGSKLGEIDLSNESTGVSNIVTAADGSVCALSYNSEYTALSLRPVNVSTLRLDEPIAELPSEAYGARVAGGSYDFCYNKGESFYGYTLATDTEEQLVTWINSDVDSNNISSACLWREGFAACAMRGNSGVELMYIGPDGSENVLTEFNSGICEEYEYSAPEALNFVNSQGREIAGWVIRPAGFEPGKKYPAILDIHGGPKTVYGSCYFHEMQLWASRGFAVLFCNPTGGDGGGDEFADIRGQYGRQDFADLMQFVDTALERCDFIDAERLGVTGGSYGGFMTNWVIGHTDRFRCAASQRSISNWVSFRNSADIGWYFAEDQVGGEPWTGLEKIWGQSPLAFADRVTTPTLFIHSEEDYRCPLSEGIQMFYALRQRGVETRMCIFRGENHELSRSGRPRNRVRRLREIPEWMERHLK